MNDKTMQQTNLYETLSSKFKRNETNCRHIARLERLLRNLLVQILQEGYYGKGSLNICVQDGVIQNITKNTEQIER